MHQRRQEQRHIQRRVELEHLNARGNRQQHAAEHEGDRRRCVQATRGQRQQHGHCQQHQHKLKGTERGHSGCLPKRCSKSVTLKSPARLRATIGKTTGSVSQHKSMSSRCILTGLLVNAQGDVAAAPACLGLRADGGMSRAVLPVRSVSRFRNSPPSRWSGHELRPISVRWFPRPTGHAATTSVQTGSRWPPVCAAAGQAFEVVNLCRA